jgi:hypothetical protein
MSIKSGSMYYKHYYSVLLQGLADARYIFIAIEVGAHGNQLDGGIFSSQFTVSASKQQ